MHREYQQQPLLLQAGMLIDGREVDIWIEQGVITQIAEARTVHTNTREVQVIDCTNVYISSGWIDMHVHAYAALTPYGDDIDEIGIKQGVTTIVDAGSCGADEISKLDQSRQQAQTRVLAFLNISHLGLRRIDELSNLEWIDMDKAGQVIQRYADWIVGLKARISRSVVKDSGIAPLLRARKMSEQYHLPLMVHIGSAPPAIQDVLQHLQKNDIITHYLNGKANNVFDEQGQPLPELTEAIERGVHLDVGHGSASFSFTTAEDARQAGIHFDTISTDIYRGNREYGPVYSMSDVLSKFLYLGYSLQEIIEAVTIRAATWLQRPELATVEVGSAVDLTLFCIQPGEKVLTDSEGEQRIADQYIEAKGVVINGIFVAC